MNKIRERIETQPRVFNKWVIKRIRKNQNAIIIFNGGTGTGKSYACIRCAIDLAHELGTDFTIEKNLAFKFTDLLEKMSLPGNDLPGTIFCMEEVGSFGSGAASREWQSQANKFFFSFLQTSRHKNQILLLNCPSFHYLERGSRLLVHFQFEASGISQREKISFFKPFFLQVNTRTGKIFFKYLRYTHNGVRKVLNRMAFKLPPAIIRHDYERDKLAFTDSLNKSILELSNGVREKTERELAFEDKREKIVDLLSQGIHKTRKISELTGIRERTVREHIYDIKRESLI